MNPPIRYRITYRSLNAKSYCFEAPPLPGGGDVEVTTTTDCCAHCARAESTDHSPTYCHEWDQWMDLDFVCSMFEEPTNEL